MIKSVAIRKKIYRAFISLIAEPRSLKRMRCPQYGHLTLTSISTFCLHRAHLYVLAIFNPDYPFICSKVRSIARCAIFIAGVCGWYAPPANLYPHFRHSQIPVPRRCTDCMSHFGQRWRDRETPSISATLLRTNLPYRQPKRPELPVTFPFAL
jgi:hypothetical protein